MPDKAYEAAQSLWEKYRVLTHELMKFIDEEEIDTFIDLVDQRERIVDMLKELPADRRQSQSALLTLRLANLSLINRRRILDKPS